MDNLILWPMAIGVVCVVLGFVALLLSRIYISDAATQQPVEVELPLLGKLKTNYPALALSLFGVALAAYAYKLNSDVQKARVVAHSEAEKIRASEPGDDQWTVTGHLVSDGSAPVDWEAGVITLIAGSPDVTVRPDGAFTIKLLIKKGTPLESYVERIDFTHASSSAQIYPPKELEKYKQDDSSSLLENQTAFTRAYKPVKVTTWTPPK